MSRWEQWRIAWFRVRNDKFSKKLRTNAYLNVSSITRAKRYESHFMFVFATTSMPVLCDFFFTRSNRAEFYLGAIRFTRRSNRIKRSHKQNCNLIRILIDPEYLNATDKTINSENFSSFTSQLNCDRSNPRLIYIRISSLNYLWWTILPHVRTNLFFLINRHL